MTHVSDQRRVAERGPPVGALSSFKFQVSSFEFQVLGCQVSSREFQSGNERAIFRVNGARIGEGCGIVKTGVLGGAVLRGRAFVWVKFGIGGQVIEQS